MRSCSIAGLMMASRSHVFHHRWYVVRPAVVASRHVVSSSVMGIVVGHIRERKRAVTTRVCSVKYTPKVDVKKKENRRFHEVSSIDNWGETDQSQSHFDGEALDNGGES